VYDADEKTAREERAGLWSGAFIRPEAWRHREKSTEILAAVSVPADAQKILLRPEPILRGLPSQLCRRADPAVAGRLRSMPSGTKRGADVEPDS